MPEELYKRVQPTQISPVNRFVAVVGEIINVDHETRMVTLELDKVNKAAVSVIIPDDQDLSTFNNLRFIEVRGECTAPKQVQMRAYTDFKANFDLGSYNEMLGLIHKDFRGIFNL